MCESVCVYVYVCTCACTYARKYPTYAYNMIDMPQSIHIYIHVRSSQLSHRLHLYRVSNMLLNVESCFRDVVRIDRSKCLCVFCIYVSLSLPFYFLPTCSCSVSSPHPCLHLDAMEHNTCQKTIVKESFSEDNYQGIFCGRACAEFISCQKAAVRDSL